MPHITNEHSANIAEPVDVGPLVSASARLNPAASARLAAGPTGHPSAAGRRPSASGLTLADRRALGG